MPARRPTLAVVLPVHRDGPELRRCLAALDASDDPPDEVVVVVDGGDLGLCEVVRPHADVVVPLVPRSGPAAARNEGVAGSVSEWLLFVDADVAVHRDTVGRARAWTGRDVDAVIGSYDDDPPAPGVLSAYKNLLNHHHHQRANPRGETFWGACGLVRRAAFEQVGGFDVDRFPRPSVEDIDLGYRLHDDGASIRVDRRMQVTHLKRWEARGLLVTDVRDRALPWSTLLVERGRLQDDLNVDVEGRAKVVATTLALLASVLAVAGGDGTRRRAAGSAATALLAGVAVADRVLLRLLWARRGPRVAVGGYLWHLCSYVYSGGAFAVALARHVAVGADGRRAATRGGAEPGPVDVARRGARS